MPSHEWHSFKVNNGSLILRGIGGKIVQQEMSEILRDNYPGCKEAGNNDDYQRSRKRQTFNMSVTWMRISFGHLQ